MIIHDTFTLERTYPHPPAKVFAGFRDPKKKRRWFAEGEGFVVDGYSLDFAVGGFERTRFRHGDGPPMTNDTVYLDLVENERIVFAYWMTVGGAPLSSSHSTIELTAVKGGTRLKLTEHTAYLDGKDGSKARREGIEELLGQLGKALNPQD